MNIAIIGGGITGLFCAHYLMKDKHRISVIEKSATGSATSVYNAGLLTPSLAPTPNIGLGRILTTYLGREGAVYISPRQILANIRWFRTALRKGLTGYEDKIVGMGRLSLKLYEEFFEEVGFRPDVIKGVSALYSDEGEARRAQSSLGGKLLDETSISQMGFRGFRGGVMFEEELSINPAKLYNSIWDAAIRHGSAELIVGEDVRLVADKGNHRLGQVYVDGRRVSCEIIILTAGSWSGDLCKQLGFDPKILPARGLAILFDTGGKQIASAPAIFEDYGIGLSQHNKTTLRVTGFFEMVGFRTDFSDTRKQWLLDRFKRHVVKADQAKIVEEGVGFRPCTPDQTPIIGLIPGYKNVYVASGSCRLGVTLAPAAADMIRAMIAETGKAACANQSSLYDPSRFA